MRNTINIGIIGTGGMGERHARNLARKIPSAAITAVMDVDTARAGNIAEACGGATVYDNAHDLIADAQVDAVLIAAPDRFHAELTLACLEAKKRVLCEKPLAITVADAKKVVDAEVAGGQRLVQLGFMREFDPAHLRLRATGKRGDLGRLLFFQGVHVNRLDGPVRQLEDVITNSVVHDLHSARWLMDDEIDRVFTSFVPGEQGRSDTARFVVIQLVFRKGGLGTIECNADADYGYEVHVKLTGERGTAETNSLSSPFVRTASNRGQWIEDDWLQRFETAYLNEAEAWVASLVNNKVSGPSAWDGYASMVAAQACIESAQTGRPVEINPLEIPGLYR